jgi:hypothetical protein
MHALSRSLLVEGAWANLWALRERFLRESFIQYMDYKYISNFV